MVKRVSKNCAGWIMNKSYIRDGELKDTETILLKCRSPRCPFCSGFYAWCLKRGLIRQMRLTGSEMWFLTFTFSKDVSLSEVQHTWEKMRAILAKKGKSFDYVIAKERTKKGRLHMHLIVLKGPGEKMVGTKGIINRMNKMGLKGNEAEKYMVEAMFLKSCQGNLDAELFTAFYNTCSSAGFIFDSEKARNAKAVAKYVAGYIVGAKSGEGYISKSRGVSNQARIAREEVAERLRKSDERINGKKVGEEVYLPLPDSANYIKDRKKFARDFVNDGEMEDFMNFVREVVKNGI